MYRILAVSARFHWVLGSLSVPLWKSIGLQVRILQSPRFTNPVHSTPLQSSKYSNPDFSSLHLTITNLSRCHIEAGVVIRQIQSNLSTNVARNWAISGKLKYTSKIFLAVTYSAWRTYYPIVWRESEKYALIWLSESNIWSCDTLFFAERCESCRL